MEGGHHHLHWVALAAALTSFSLGLSGIVTLVGAAFAFLAGFLSLWYGLTTSKEYARSEKLARKPIRQRNVRPVVAAGRVPDTNGGRRDGDKMVVLTGFPQIDTPLNEIIAFVFRDFVYSWHFGLTHSHSFPTDAEDSLHLIVAALANKIRKVDWIPYLTTSLVDDVASHVKLFRKARLALREQRSQGAAADLESLFFDAEFAMEGKVCRDLVSTIQQEELGYLQSVAEILLFLLMPEADFSASPFRVLLREIVVNSLLKPTLEMVSDPDFINQTLVWLYSDYKIKPDVFTSAIRNSESVEELSATSDKVASEINYLRSNDSKGEMDSTLKQRLDSLLYLRKVINGRIHQVQSRKGFAGLDDDDDPSHDVDWNQTIEPGKMKLFVLPLEVLLKNNIAISYFIDYMTSIGCQSYVFFYLNVEGWKVSAEQQIQALELDAMRTGDDVMTEQQKSSLMENMREAAHSIYEEYLSDRAVPKLKIDESAAKRLLFKIRTEPPDAEWFDETQERAHAKLADDERFLEAFRQSYGYVKLLAELDLLKDAEDSASLGEEEQFSIYDSLSLNSYDSSNCAEEKGEGEETEPPPPPPKVDSKAIEARVIDVATVKDGLKSYAVYTLLVKISSVGGEEELRHVYRRYSDFHALHGKVCAQFPRLSELPFPKKTLLNMDRSLLDRRRRMLDAYLEELLRPATLHRHFGLVIPLERFLDHASSYELERQQAETNVMKAVGSVKNSVKNVTSAVTSVPNNLIDNVSRALNNHPKHGAISDEKVGAAIDVETAGNIPLRIMLLFMDEVFDLRERNQWLRRQIVAVLRQLIKAMFGDIVNRRIVDYFAQMTSPENVGNYLESFKNNRWPDGYPAAEGEPRDENTKMRTRVAARAALLSIFSDDLRRVIGSETSRTGLLTLFDMLQRPVLNKRLGVVIMEGVLKTTYSDQHFDSIFQKLHSRSSRVRNELKNSQRTFSDIRR